MARFERGFAQQFLTWTWWGNQLEAEISRAKYFVRPWGREVVVWAEARGPGGKYRIDIGTYADVVRAKEAAERHAAGVLSSCQNSGGAADRPVDVRIVPVRRTKSKRQNGTLNFTADTVTKTGKPTTDTPADTPADTVGLADRPAPSEQERLARDKAFAALLARVIEDELEAEAKDFLDSTRGTAGA